MKGKDKEEEICRNFGNFYLQLLEAKAALEGIANAAERRGYKVTLQFEDRRMLKGNEQDPHKIQIKLSKLIP